MGHILKSGDIIMTNKIKGKTQRRDEVDVVLVDIHAAAKMLSISRSTILRLNDFPEPLKFGKLHRWRVSDLRAYIDQKAA